MCGNGHRGGLAGLENARKASTIKLRFVRDLVRQDLVEDEVGKSLLRYQSFFLGRGRGSGAGAAAKGSRRGTKKNGTSHLC